MSVYSGKGTSGSVAPRVKVAVIVNTILLLQGLRSALAQTNSFPEIPDSLKLGTSQPLGSSCNLALLKEFVLFCM